MTVSLQVCDVRVVEGDLIQLSVRCLAGPVSVGTRLGAGNGIHLTLTEILVYRRSVDVLDTALTALVTLRGHGADRVRFNFNHVLRGVDGAGEV
ncbi:hypothetical protein [Actinoplanes sp. NPDC051851]|uniref:hypothetical protein n=1 Tax=Actinoplanes sp. NPDC051851 TaxID=3154753 RepID=UPI00341A174A